MSSCRSPRISTATSPAERRIVRPSSVRSHPDPERITWKTAAPNRSRPRPHGAVSWARAINDPDIWMLRSATLNGSTALFYSLTVLASSLFVLVWEQTWTLGQIFHRPEHGRKCTRAVTCPLFPGPEEDF